MVPDAFQLLSPQSAPFLISTDILKDYCRTIYKSSPEDLFEIIQIRLLTIDHHIDHLRYTTAFVDYRINQ